MSRFIRFATTALLLTLLLVGCGQKGTWECSSRACPCFMQPIERLRAGTVPKGDDYKTCPHCLERGRFRPGPGTQYGG